MRELIEKRNELPNNEKRILTETAILCLNKKFWRIRKFFK